MRLIQPPMEILIRPLEEQDAPLAARIHVDSWRAAYRGLVPDEFLRNLSYGGREDMIRKAISSRLEETYLVEVSSMPAGLLTIGACRDADLAARNPGEIWGIYLLPEFWRCGIGSQLVNEAEAILRGKGYGLITLWVFEGNVNARMFYEAVGYLPDGSKKKLNCGKILVAIRYQKSLISPGIALLEE